MTTEQEATKQIVDQIRLMQIQPSGEMMINGHRVTRSALYWYVDDHQPLTLWNAARRILD